MGLGSSKDSKPQQDIELHTADEIKQQDIKQNDKLTENKEQSFKTPNT
jgi:hypothetical protein